MFIYLLLVKIIIVQLITNVYLIVISQNNNHKNKNRFQNGWTLSLMLKISTFMFIHYFCLKKVH